MRSDADDGAMFLVQGMDGLASVAGVVNPDDPEAGEAGEDGARDFGKIAKERGDLGF